MGEEQLQHMALDDLLDQGMDGLELVMGYSAMPVEISAMLCCFALLFLVGFFGNLTVIIRILRTQRQLKQVFGKGEKRKIALQRYVLLLACVDLFVTMMIPMLFPYLYSGQWLIGAAMCKLFWIVDNVNKILSVHVLTAMAIERYFIVRNSVYNNRKRTIPRIATSIFFAGTFFSLVLLTPLINYVQLDISEFGNTNITTCVSPMPDELFVAFNIYMFVLSYCIPVVVVTFCYGSLVHILKQRYKITNMTENSKTQLVQKVSKSIMCVTCFHFVCWTPFWVSSLLPILQINVLEMYPRLLMVMQMFILMLPYVNCSFNWCFYVLLNQRLRKQIFRRSSSHATKHSF